MHWIHAEKSHTLSLDSLSVAFDDMLFDYIIYAPDSFDKYVTRIGDVRLGAGPRYLLLRLLDELHEQFPDGQVPMDMVEIRDMPKLSEPIMRRLGKRQRKRPVDVVDTRGIGEYNPNPADAVSTGTSSTWYSLNMADRPITSTQASQWFSRSSWKVGDPFVTVVNNKTGKIESISEDGSYTLLLDDDRNVPANEQAWGPVRVNELFLDTHIIPLPAKESSMKWVTEKKAYVNIGLKGKLLIAADALPKVPSPSIGTVSDAGSTTYKAQGEDGGLKMNPGKTADLPKEGKPKITTDTSADSETYKASGPVEKLLTPPANGYKTEGDQPHSDVNPDSPQFRSASVNWFKVKAEATADEQKRLIDLKEKEKVSTQGGAQLTPDEHIEIANIEKKSEGK